MTFPFFGALPCDDGVLFRVMGPAADSAGTRPLQLVIHTGSAAGSYDLDRAAPGIWETHVPHAGAGDRYGYRVHGGPGRPDPASRYQPDGVHASSAVVDPAGFRWEDDEWQGIRPPALVVYELHVGAFTSEGTFQAAACRLPALRDLGVTAIELMPLADFPGSRNWGYDGVSLFAPARAYGRPDDLRAFVNTAHRLGLGVILDVVYNHLGPEGNYISEFNPRYITGRHTTPWGGAVNLIACGSEVVRRFIVDNAVHWIREYHLDGLRFDATHALIDESPVHVVAEIADEVRRAARWPVTLHAEDHRNLASIVLPRSGGGWGLDGVWADDYHHIVRRMVAGDAHGYYTDFEGTAEELARTIRQGWLYTGQPSRHMHGLRGTDPSGVPMQRSVVCLQNHDQVGNRAAGDRLHHTIDAAAWRAASVALLTSPMTPLLFMGQEWAASTPFIYFTELEPELGKAVTAGRRREFQDFPGFDPSREVPDPQAESSFLASKLRWDERSTGGHASTLALYRMLLALRAAHPALQASEEVSGEAWAVGDAALVMRRTGDADVFLIVVSLRAAAAVDYSSYAPASEHFDVVLTTEDAAVAPDPTPPTIAPPMIRLHRPGAVILRFDRG